MAKCENCDGWGILVVPAHFLVGICCELPGFETECCFNPIVEEGRREEIVDCGPCRGTGRIPRNG